MISTNNNRNTIEPTDLTIYNLYTDPNSNTSSTENISIQVITVTPVLLTTIPTQKYL